MVIWWYSIQTFRTFVDLYLWFWTYTMYKAFYLVFFMIEQKKGNVHMHSSLHTYSVSEGWESTAVSPGTESLVIIKSWLRYLHYFEDWRYDVNCYTAGCIPPLVCSARKRYNIDKDPCTDISNVWNLEFFFSLPFKFFLTSPRFRLHSYQCHFWEVCCNQRAFPGRPGCERHHCAFTTMYCWILKRPNPHISLF